MSSLLTTGISALTSFRRALDVTGNNISNVNTEGYSRQRVNFSSREPQLTGAGYIGRGVETSSVERSYSNFLDTQVRTANTSFLRLDTLAQFAGRLDDMLADPDGGLTPALSRFYAAVQDFANTPNSNSAREALFAEAGSLAFRIESLDQRLADVESETNGAIAQNVGEINRLAESIAELNTRIVAGGVQNPPNDLLDQRDQLIRELSGKIAVTVAPQRNGSVSLFIGNGQTLVIDAESYPLSAEPSEFNPTRLDVSYRGVSGETNVTGLLSGGVLGGLLEFRETVLDPARRSLGATAAAIGTAFNAQNAQGLTAADQFGGDIFSFSGPVTTSSTFNAGAATVDASIADLGEIGRTDYQLRYDGSAYRLFRADNGQEVALTGSGSSGDPFTGAGLSIVVSGAASAGDRFLIRPTASVAGSFERVAQTGNDFAAAAPVRANAAETNLSDATIDNGTVIDASDPNLQSTSVIEFTSPTTYSINGAGSFAYTAGTPLTVNGADFRISGDPTTGDRFTLEANTAAAGDNRNALGLASVEARGVLDGGTTSASRSYSALVASVGSATRQSQASAEAQSVVLQGAETRRLEVSGVNLDEEAANLVRFQQSYQAAAQIISVASTLFDTLIAATRR
jgi:flagellar hook-associated protein 1 FlgK